jgi:Tol biopolymer transport system component
MRKIQLSYTGTVCLFSFIWLVLLSTCLRTEHAAVFERKSTKPSEQSNGTTSGARGRYNGKLVFSSDRQNDGGLKLWIMNPDGSNQTQLTFESERGPTLPSYVPVDDEFCKWSPDGTRIALKSNRNLDLNAPASEAYTVYVMDYQGQNVQRLILDQLPALSGHTDAEITRVEWSPDSARLAFAYGKVISSDTSEEPYSDIFTVKTDGSALTRLTFNGASVAPEWSPDGNQIVFYSAPAGIYVMNSDGSSRRELAAITNIIGDAAWSPDGSKVLFARSGQPCGTETCTQLFTLSTDGTELKQLTYSPMDHWSPRWSPDGTKIVFVRHSSGPKYAIFVMNADGSEEQEISNRAPKSFQIDDEVDWQPLSAALNDPPPSVVGLNSGLYLAQYPTPPNVDIVVTRSGNTNQTVSCDYQIRLGNLTGGLPSGTLSFAPGDTSKTIQLVSSYFSSPENISLFNNVGNATFVGGIKDATIILADRGTNPIDFSAFFVRQQYYDFLNREPDKSGWDYWTNNMDSCPQGSTGPVCRDIKAAKHIDTSAAFFLSIEFQQTGYLVYRTYKAAYGNLPGAPVPIRLSEFLPDTQQIGQGVVVGQSGWEQALETNKQNFMTSFVQRLRFTSAYPSSMTVQQFVDALYTNAGLTPALAPNRPVAISEFNSTTPSDPAARARALRDVAEDPMLTQQEFNRAFVLMQYFGYLRRNPNDAPDSDFIGYNFWLGKLNQFGGNYQGAEMVKAFIVSTEYRQRFGP